MILFRHELRRGRTAWIIWTAAISLMLAASILLFPEIASQTEQINEMFSQMGSFTSAFGMDRLNFGTVTGYYAVECGNTFGLGGAFFAAMLAAAMLSKEEKERTAEFLLAHPISRTRIVLEKLMAVYAQVVAMNAVIFAVSVGSVAVIGEQVPWKEIALLCLAYLLLQLEIASLCFGVSAFVAKGAAGIGIGIAVFMYFLNIIGNITDRAKFLKYITPYGYCDGADIVASGGLDLAKISVGFVFAAAGVAAAFIKYRKKDIS
ncbi:MAG: ABC transporter permease subunit [Clostridia bacterium]|nr:ABC transporter permease subunit [Clostridia bacterium]